MDSDFEKLMQPSQEKHLEDLIKQGDVSAMVALAKMKASGYYQYYPIQPDHQRAINLLERAAALGSRVGKKSLAELLALQAQSRSDWLRVFKLYHAVGEQSMIASILKRQADAIPYGLFAEDRFRWYPPIVKRNIYLWLLVNLRLCVVPAGVSRIVVDYIATDSDPGVDDRDAFCVACKRGTLADVKSLVQFRADCAVRNETEPLFLAIRYNSVDVVEALLVQSVRGRQSGGVLHLASKNDCIHLALRLGRNDVVALITRFS